LAIQPHLNIHRVGQRAASSTVRLNWSKNGLETAKRGEKAESDGDGKTSDSATDETRPKVLNMHDLATKKPRPARRGNKAEGTGLYPARFPISLQDHKLRRKSLYFNSLHACG
jgi:hypothetical protein